MSIKQRIGLSCALALSLAACGTNESTDDAGTQPPVQYPGADAAVQTPGADAAVQTPGADAAVPTVDTAPVAVDPYIYVVVQDTEQVACTTNGPGADIDAVAKVDATTGKATGWGMIGSAEFFPNEGGNACENSDCAGGNCKYAAISSAFTEDDLVARTEGPVDGKVNASTSDIGYFSLNAGRVRLQIGDAVTGAGPAQEIKAGDFIAVYEVDQTYPLSGYAPASCSCLPEHYTVTLQTASGKLHPLTASRLETANTTCSALTATSVEGCGTTVFYYKP
jgi:hypothetical protein